MGFIAIIIFNKYFYNLSFFYIITLKTIATFKKEEVWRSLAKNYN